MTVDEFCDELVSYISRISDQEVGPESPLLGEGIIDSFNVLEIISFIEEVAGLRIRPDEVSLENFASPRSLAGWISARTAAAENA